MLRKTILTLAAVLCISGTAYAGDGPPQTFADLKYMVEQVIQPQIDYLQSTGQFQYWAENECVQWSNMTDNLMAFFMFESKFRAAATNAVAVNNGKITLAQKTGLNVNMIPSYKLARLKAQNQLTLMNGWRDYYTSYYYNVAWGNRTYYCWKEVMCVPPEPEPQYSTVSVSRFPIPPVVYAGYGQTFFGFNLAMVSGDSQLDEDGQFDQVVVAMFITGDQYDRVHNCSLVSGGFTMSYTGGPDFTPGDKYGVLVFNVQPNTVIPKGTAAAFSVTCDILVPFEPDTAIQTGFFVDKGTPPIDAIVIHGANTAEKLQVTPNEDIYSTVVAY